jgi:AmiR/NasT family two-component response regulator
MAAPLRVVIAEDETLVAELVAHDLARRGMDVVGRANDGQRAVELACDLRPDVVLMDIRMPVMDGIEATRQIMASAPTAIVMLTAHAEEEFWTQAAAAGAGAYLTKPVQADELVRAISVAKARAADLAELRRLSAELRASLERIETLKGMLPICSSCKKIRDAQGQWRDVEAYVRDHSRAEFTHSFCPDCIARLYPEMPKLL